MKGIKLNILSLDVGTTSIRGVLFSMDGETLVSHAVSTPLLFAEEKIEQSPVVFTDALLEICRVILSSFTIDAISLTAYRSAPALLDRDGQALTNFIMWQDRRNQQICESLSCNNDLVHQICGANINTVFTAGKLTWLKQNRPDAWQKAYKAAVVPDYLLHFMSGVFATDYTYGSRTLLMDLESKTWDDGLCKLFDIEQDKLCDLIPQGSVAGRTTAKFAQLSGVKEGIPVISAGGDQQCGALGLGVTDKSRLIINLGTGAFILTLTDEPVLTEPAIICNVAAVHDKYTLESNVLTAASALNWAMDTFFADLKKDGKPDFKAFNDLAASAPLCANGLTCLPLFSGCGTRHWSPEARASFQGMSLSTSRADIARALYEGIAAEIANSIAFMPIDKATIKEISLSGGLSQSAVFNQILCDMLGIPLIRYHNAQATAIGAFASAAVALGNYASYEQALLAARKSDTIQRFTPSQEAHLSYQSYLKQYNHLFSLSTQV